jgi:hypothetical protein
MTEEDIVRPLRPIDFISPGEDKPEFSFTVPDRNDPDLILRVASDDVLRAKFVKLNEIITKFQEIFKEQYLLSLRERHKGSNSNLEIQPRVGDVVLFGDDKGPPAFWRLGRVHQLIEADDGHCRTVVLRVHNPSSQIPHYLSRATNQIYPFIAQPLPEPSCSRQVQQQMQPAPEQPTSASTPIDSPQKLAEDPSLHNDNNIPISTRSNRIIKMPTKFQDFHCYPSINNIYSIAIQNPNHNLQSNMALPVLNESLDAWRKVSSYTGPQGPYKLQHWSLVQQADTKADTTVHHWTDIWKVSAQFPHELGDYTAPTMWSAMLLKRLTVLYPKHLTFDEVQDIVQHIDPLDYNHMNTLHRHQNRLIGLGAEKHLFSKKMADMFLVEWPKMCAAAAEDLKNFYAQTKSTVLFQDQLVSIPAQGVLDQGYVDHHLHQ